MLTWTARMNHASRRVLTATRKRKDREDSSFFSQHGSKGNFGKLHKFQQPPSPANNSSNTTSSSSVTQRLGEPGSVPSNRILAGYMAHEYLTRGTLFGQKFDPARAEAVPLAAADPKRKPGSEQPEPAKPSRSYADVAQLLKADGDRKSVV